VCPAISGAASAPASSLSPSMIVHFEKIGAIQDAIAGSPPEALLIM
jgi:hypothetical protein